MTEKKSLKDRIYESVLEEIFEGRYLPNAIINERMLIEKYGVSKTPVREALVQLCTEGILNNLPRFGYQLVPITPQEIGDIQELRLLLELGALEKTMQTITEEQLAQLEKNVESAQSLVEDRDIKKHWFQNISFHLLLCSFCGNAFIYEHLDRVLHFCSRGAGQYFQKTWSESKLSDANEHRALIEFIRRKDFERAKETLARDVSAMKNEILNS